MKAYIRPMTITEGIIPLMMSKIMLLIQYAVRDIPDINCMCFKLFSLSFNINETTTAGIKAKPMETTKAMKSPEAVAALYLSF